MFSRWKLRAAPRSASNHRYRPLVERLEGRELPAVSLGVGQVVNVSQALGNQREQAIAVNPVNTNQVVAVSNIEDITGDNVADRGVFEAWSVDGGQTWNTQYLFTDTTQPEASIGDPQLAWDTFGNLFFTYVNVGGDIVVALSTDGGQSFRPQIITLGGGLHDQPAIAVGPGPYGKLQSVWISYTFFPTGGIPVVQTQTAVVAGFGLVGGFGLPKDVPGSDQVRGNFGDIAIGPRGEAIVTYQSTGTAAGPSLIYVNIDPDGMGPAEWSQRVLVTQTNIGAARLIPGQSNNLGIDAEPSLAIDRSNGPFRGRAYLTYTDASSIITNDTNVMLRFSDNGGVTWSAPVRVNDDVGGGSQFNQAIAVDPFTGLVGMAWYDTRNDSVLNLRAEMFAGVSDNGGLTFKNIKVSTGQSQSSLAEPPSTGVRALGYGDFNKIAFVHGILQVVWADNSPGLIGNPDPLRMDIATARVIAVPAQSLAIRIFLPARWRLIDKINRIYQGFITIVNKTGTNLRGPIQVTLVLPHPSLNLVFPAGTRVGNTVTFTVNADLLNRVPLRILAQISNPLRKRLPNFLKGYASSLA